MLKNEEFIQEFIEEAGSHIEQIESHLLELAGDVTDQELINQLFRSVHSIKGTAGFFGLDNIVNLSHSMESLFGAVRSGGVYLDDLSIDALLEANDCLGIMVKDPAKSHEIDISHYTHNLDTILSEDTKKVEGDSVGTSHEPPSPQDHIQPAGGNIPTVLVEDSIRVSIGLLNDLLNLTGELVLGRNQLLRGLEGHRKHVEGLDPVLQNIDSITTQLQERVMQTRMQPLGNVFNKFPRIIRELSRQLKKEIRLEMEGTQVELDKSIIESLADPLTHLIRNAADHGIEKPGQREDTGKSREGLITIRASQEGGYVSILVADDGAGIDVNFLKNEILKKGLRTQEELSLMEEKEILGQILLPGFSTAGSVTDVSGRGVGMDVVRTNIERMGGTIEIDSQAGRGTTFKLNLPMTLAIISSLIVESGGQNFALPQVNLQEMIRVKEGDKDRSIEIINGFPVLHFRHKLLPILSLSQVLDLPEDLPQPGKEDNHRTIRILVLKMGERRFGLAVDAIRDDEEILVKPLPRHLKDLKCYSGVTILGDGKIAMILDAEGLASQGELKFPEAGSDPKKKQDIKQAATGDRTMLLFSCSGAETLGLELSLVSRVEEIKHDDIELIGEREYIEFRGRSLELIRPEEHLPISRNEYKDQRLYVIIPKVTGPPVGLLIGKIHDSVSLSWDFNRQDIKAHGIMGTTFWNSRTVLALDLPELLQKAAPEDYGAGDSDTMGSGAGRGGRY